MSLLGGGIAHADVPVPNPTLPPLPGLPASGQPINILIAPPSVATAPLPPPPEGCTIYASYDNTGTNPPGSVFRGQTACGLGVFNPVLTGYATLQDIFGNTVAGGNGYGQVGGVGTSQGDYVLQGGLGGVGSTGPVPGLEYTISYDTSITLTWPQFWSSPSAGCSISGQTLVCHGSTTYSYIPGTQGGFTPG